jgi:hypothetical protein
MHHVQKLASVEDHIKNYRPQILCLSGEPAERPHLVNLCTQMTRDSGICLLGHVCEKRAEVFENTHQKKLDEADIKARVSKSWLCAGGFFSLFFNRPPCDGVPLSKSTARWLFFHPPSLVVIHQGQLYKLGYSFGQRNCLDRYIEKIIAKWVILGTFFSQKTIFPGYCKNLFIKK